MRRQLPVGGRCPGSEQANQSRLAERNRSEPALKLRFVGSEEIEVEDSRCHVGRTNHVGEAIAEREELRGVEADSLGAHIEVADAEAMPLVRRAPLEVSNFPDLAH